MRTGIRRDAAAIRARTGNHPEGLGTRQFLQKQITEKNRETTIWKQGAFRFLPSFGLFLHPVVRAETGRSAVSIGVVSKRSVPHGSAVTAPSVAPFAQNRNLRKRNRRRQSAAAARLARVNSHRRSGGAGGSGCWQQLGVSARSLRARVSERRERLPISKAPRPVGLLLTDDRKAQPSAATCAGRSRR